MKPPVKRCAIYTRKSSEEGLEQEFNSLDAQYESCLAYITSQKAEGWILIKGRYDDGGFSGGNLERPGLRQLMADIESGKVDTVVVYKIDRLTRSLMDFAKLVEVFDRHGVTFVSITQSFNTTTSMGRLTLNVLLSFAQFEREVTGERIRDKIAASKKKGMWMGGYAPVGYNIADKKLVVDSESAPLVQMLFERYHALGCVSALKRELDREGITSRVWSSSTGLQHGGASFSRGILYKILRNPVYIGQISHKGIIYDGQHETIIGNELWNNVQAQMVGHAARSRGRTSVPMAELLKGKIFDPDGRPYSPTYTSKGNRRYRYYISQNLLQCRDHPKGIIARLPAQELEDTVLNGIMSIFSENHLAAIFGLEMHDVSLRYIIANKTKIDSQKLVERCLSRVTLQSSSLELQLTAETLKGQIDEALALDLPYPAVARHPIELPFVVGRAKTGSLLLAAPRTAAELNDPFNRPEEEIRRWVQGIIWRDEHFRGLPMEQIAKREGVSSTHIYRLINLSLEMA
jgi:DNA invertase Pin-like site-specific DNA recombinase